MSTIYVEGFGDPCGIFGAQLFLQYEEAQDLSVPVRIRGANTVA